MVQISLPVQVNGVFLSTNNGSSWTAVNTGLTDTIVRAFTVSGTNLFAGTGSWNWSGGSVFLSTNNGTSWTEINYGLPSSGNVNDLVVYNNGTGGVNLFAGTTGGVFLAHNNDTTWTEVNSGLENNNVNALVISENYLFAGTTGSSVWRRPLSEMITSIQDLSNQIPTKFKLEQNYPNPFNPSKPLMNLSPRITTKAVAPLIVMIIFSTFFRKSST